MQKNIIQIILLAFSLKLVYFLFACVIAEFHSIYHVQCSLSEFFSLFKRNDSYWYQKVAEEGYPVITNPLDLGYSNGTIFKQSVWAHFPIYPLSIRLTEQLFHLSFEQSAFILSLLFSISAFLSYYFVCLHLFKVNEKDSLFYTFLFMLFPFHYYYSMYYTEAPFFTFLAASFVSIALRKYYWTALLIIPLSLVRPNGIVCLVPLFFYFIEVEIGYENIKSNGIKMIHLYWKKMMCFATGPIALGLYCLYQKQMTGFYFAFVKAQSGWYKEFMFPLLGLFRRSDFASQFNSVYTLIFLLISVIAWKKLPLSLNLLIWLSILLPLTSGSAACMPRYISVIFPLTIYITSFVVNLSWKKFILISAFLLQLLTFYPWLLGDPFSY